MYLLQVIFIDFLENNKHVTKKISGNNEEKVVMNIN